MVNPVLSAVLSGQRKILLSWTFGNNADFQVFWKSSSPPGQEYVLLATTNSLSYITGDLNPSVTYSFFVRANVGVSSYDSNAVSLFVACGQMQLLQPDYLIILPFNDNDPVLKIDTETFTILDVSLTLPFGTESGTSFGKYVYIGDFGDGLQLKVDSDTMTVVASCYTNWTGLSLVGNTTLDRVTDRASDDPPPVPEGHLWTFDTAGKYAAISGDGEYVYFNGILVDYGTNPTWVWRVIDGDPINFPNGGCWDLHLSSEIGLTSGGIGVIKIRTSDMTVMSYKNPNNELYDFYLEDWCTTVTDGNYVYVDVSSANVGDGSIQSNLKLDKDTLEIVDVFPVMFEGHPYENIGATVIVGGFLYIAANSGNDYGLPSDDVTRIFKIDLSTYSLNSVSDGFLLSVGVRPDLWEVEAYNGKLYFADPWGYEYHIDPSLIKAEIFVIDATTLAVEHNFQVPDVDVEIEGVTAIGEFLFVNGDNKVYKYNISTLSLIDTLTIPMYGERLYYTMVSVKVTSSDEVEILVPPGPS
jgi:hypothetical protein